MMRDPLLLRAWTVLIGVARARTTITYAGLVERLDWPCIPLAVGRRLLEPIHTQFILGTARPDLPAVVVRADTGYPGWRWWWPSEGNRTLSQKEKLAIWRRALKASWNYSWPERP